jgi:hypothetical protein
MKRALTDKQLNNKRFKSTEESILLAYCILKDHLSPGLLARSACISRSTFYRHHENVAGIVSDYEIYIYNKTKTILTRLVKIKYLRLGTIYERLLGFISTNQTSMSFIVDFGNSDFLEHLLLIIEPKLISATKLKNREAFLVYINEVASLIRFWRMADFDRHQIPELVDKIVYLTNTANIRLSPLASFNCEYNRLEGEKSHKICYNNIK